MNNRRAQNRKNNTFVKGHLNTPYSRPEEKRNWLTHLGKNSTFQKPALTSQDWRQGEKSNWLMVIITLILQLLASIIFFSGSKSRKKKLGR